MKLKDQTQKASYSIGLTSSMYLRRDMDMGTILPEIDLEAYLGGIKDGLLENEPQISREEIEVALGAFRDKMEEKQKEALEANIKIGAEFLEKNAAEDGVTVTESGLQYKVLTEGKGDKPTAEDEVEVHYSGRLIDGTEFDSSYSRGEPTKFLPTQVIPGWTEALLMMSEGSKWTVFLPGDIAYGERGSPPAIGPNEVLVFDIELIKIHKA